MKTGILKNSLFVLFALLSVSVFAAGKVSVKSEVESIDMHGNVNLAVKGNVFSAKGFSAADIVSVKVGKHSFSAPVVKNYSDVDNGEYLVRVNDLEVSIAINKGNISSSLGIKEGDDVTISLKEKNGYLLKYQLRVLQKGFEREKYDSDEVFANFRAVSTKGISGGKLYRSSNPVIDDVRAPYAASLIESNKIATVLNLANTKEQVQTSLDDFPYYSELVQDGNVIFLNMGAAFGDADFSKKFKTALEYMLSHKGPYLIHGKEGKTRTGFVCAILEALTGSSLEEITEDYMTSFENYYGVKKGSAQYNVLSSAVSEMFTSINGGKKVTDKTLQKTVRQYLEKTVGLTVAQIDSLVDLLK